jgi:hypothetical protein
VNLLIESIPEKSEKKEESKSRRCMTVNGPKTKIDCFGKENCNEWPNCHYKKHHWWYHRKCGCGQEFMTENPKIRFCSNLCHRRGRHAKWGQSIKVEPTKVEVAVEQPDVLPVVQGAKEPGGKDRKAEKKPRKTSGRKRPAPVVSPE